MNWTAIARLLGVLCMLYSLTFIPPMLVSLWFDDQQLRDFLIAAVLSVLIGAVLWAPVRTDRSELGIREGFLIVALFWSVLSLLSAVPFIIGIHLDLTDAVFEAVSGFTTTGATVVSGLDTLPASVLYHRQQIQWLGGIGIIVLAVAVLPLLGVGGMQLYRAETTGIAKNEKLTPRIANTARALGVMYLVLTGTCALAYLAAGMSPFDALAHAFTTVSTGGFSLHDLSIAQYDSVAVEVVCMVFMIAGAINFAVHFAAWHGPSRSYWDDQETRTFLLLAAAAIALVATTLIATGFMYGFEAIRAGAFQVISVMTSTGFATDTFALWPLFLPLLLMILAYIGACAGSTAGGIKIVRILLLVKIGLRQLKVLAHPNRVILVKLGNRRVPEDILYAVLGYYILYVVTALVLTLAMMAAGLNLETAFGAVTATITLLGPGLGEVASSFAGMSDAVKWMGIFAMLVGRLEVFTLLILFTPWFWRR